METIILRKIMVLRFHQFIARCESPKYFRFSLTLTGFRVLIFMVFPTFAISVNAISVEQKKLSVFEVKAISKKKILPTTRFNSANEAEKIKIMATRGEYEPFSFVIAVTEDVLDIQPILMSDLRSDNDTISSKNVNIRLVKSWFQGCIDSIHYRHCPLGKGRFLVPELLLKDGSLIRVDRARKMNWLKANVSGMETYVDITSAEKTERERGDDRNIPLEAEFNDSDSLRPVNIKKNENQQYWVTLYVPPESSPGRYTGRILIEGRDLPSRELVIELEVLPFELSDSGLEHSIYYKGRLAGKKQIIKGVSTDLKTEEQFFREMKNLVQHGVESTTITQTYRKTDNLYKKNLRLRNQAGMNSRLYVLWSGSYFEKKILAKNLMNYAKRFGFDKVYFYGGEELSDEGWSSQEEKWESMRSIGGKIFIGKSDPGIAKIVDLAVGGIRKLTKEQAMERAAAYHQFDHRIFARSNPQVGVENADVYRRNYGMLLLALGYDGSMNYAYQDSWGSVWNDFDGYFRDHVFAYPTSDGLVDTIQWEGFREAVDDARYLSTLNTTIEAAKKANLDVEKIEAWIRDIDFYTVDLNMIRKQIISEILALRKALAAS